MSTVRAVAPLVRLLWHPGARVLLGLGFSSLALFWVTREMDWGSLGGQLQHLPLVFVLASLALFALASVLRAYRWKALLVGHRFPVVRLLAVQNAGAGLNNVAPVRVLGEAVQYAVLTLHYGMRGEVVVATLGIQRVLDFVASASLLGAALWALPQSRPLAPYVMAAGVVAALSVLAVPLFVWLSTRTRLAAVPLAASISSFLGLLFRAKANLALALLLTLGHWLLMGLSGWVLAYGMGIHISVWVATLVIVGTLTFTTLVPSLPAAVGTFELTVSYLLGFFDVAQAPALGFALVIHAVLFLPPMLVALLAFSAWAFWPRPWKGSGLGADLSLRRLLATAAEPEKPT